MQDLGIIYQINWSSLSLDTSNLNTNFLDFDKIKQIRASILLLSPILFLFWKVTIPFPWWCNIGARPIDNHLNWLKAIGFDCIYDNNLISLSWKIKIWDIVLDAWFSVTSTENLIIANVLRKWKTTIMSSAFEPHVINLIDFLRNAGADIKLTYDHKIIISWVDQLKDNVEFDIISDYIESGTFIVIWALLAENFIDIKNARIKDLYVFLEKLKEAWVIFEDIWNDTLRVYRARNLSKVNIQTNIYPGFPTDLQSVFAILQTQCEWISKIHEILFEGRLNYLVELESIGVDLRILNPHEAIIIWKSKFKSWKTLNSWDLRAGVAMVIVGLLINWETKVDKVEYIFRWYENLIYKLNSLWADIKLI